MVSENAATKIAKALLGRDISYDQLCSILNVEKFENTSELRVRIIHTAEFRRRLPDVHRMLVSQVHDNFVSAKAAHDLVFLGENYNEIRVRFTALDNKAAELIRSIDELFHEKKQIERSLSELETGISSLKRKLADG